jgi:hypothetical protein
VGARLGAGLSAPVGEAVPPGVAAADVAVGVARMSIPIPTTGVGVAVRVASGRTSTLIRNGVGVGSTLARGAAVRAAGFSSGCAATGSSPGPRPPDSTPSGATPAAQAPMATTNMPPATAAAIRSTASRRFLDR